MGVLLNGTGMGLILPGMSQDSFFFLFFLNMAWDWDETRLLLWEWDEIGVKFHSNVTL